MKNTLGQSSVNNFFNKYYFLIVLFNIFWFSLFYYILFYGKSAFLFWVLSLSAGIIIVLQIILFEDNRKLNIIFIEIFFLAFTLLLVKYMYAGLDNILGLDQYTELNAVNVITTTGHWNPLYHAPNTVYPYPLVHIFESTISQITNLGVMQFDMGVGAFFYFMTILFYLLLSNVLLKNKKATLLASLGFIFAYPNTLESFSGRMPLSILLFFVLLYLILKDNTSWIPFKYSILSILILTAILFVHPLIQILIVLFLIIYLILYKIFSKKTNFISSIFKKIGFTNVKTTVRIPNLYLLIFFIIGLLGYIIYFTLNYDPSIYLLKILIFGSDSQFKPGLGLMGSLIDKIYDYGQLVFLIVFFLLIFKYRRKIQNLNILSIIFFSIFAILANIIIYLYNLVNLYRVFVFVWPMILLPVTYVIQNSNRKKFISFLMIGFILVAMCGYHVFQYDRSATPNFDHCEPDLKLSQPIKSAVLNSDYHGKIVGDYYFNQAFEGYKNTQITMDINFYLTTYKNNTYYSWFFLHEQDQKCIYITKNPTFAKVTKELYKEYQNIFDKTYSNGEIEIYKILKNQK